MRSLEFMFTCKGGNFWKNFVKVLTYRTVLLFKENEADFKNVFKVLFSLGMRIASGL
jgi:hypothetical protein